MRTVGKHHPRNKPLGTFTCDICGVLWQRHMLRKKRDGLWYCPDDFDGRVSITLSEGNAAAAAKPRPDKPKPSGANWDSENGTGSVDHLTTSDHLP